MERFIVDDPSFADDSITVLAEVAGALAVKHELPAVVDFGFGNVVV